MFMSIFNTNHILSNLILSSQGLLLTIIPVLNLHLHGGLKGTTSRRVSFGTCAGTNIVYHAGGVHRHVEGLASLWGKRWNRFPSCHHRMVNLSARPALRVLLHLPGPAFKEFAQHGEAKTLVLPTSEPIPTLETLRNRWSSERA